MSKFINIMLAVTAVVVVTQLFAGEIEVPDKNIRLEAQKKIDGYTNTPMLPPEKKWHVHDPNRPQPPVAEPKYDGKPVPAPEDAEVIYDGTGKDGFRPNKKWKEKDGVLIAGGGFLVSKKKFGDMHLHLEWMVPPDSLKGWGQKQGNSGVYLMNRYEIQILNCWGNRTYPDGMVGALYGQKPPLVNACRKPGQWNSYDIHFAAPLFEDKNEPVRKARVTVYLNNVLVQDDAAFIGSTTWRKVGKYKKHPPKEPFKLQHHGNPVRFRNIWVAPLKLELGDKK